MLISLWSLLLLSISVTAQNENGTVIELTGSNNTTDPTVGLPALPEIPQNEQKKANPVSRYVEGAGDTLADMVKAPFKIAADPAGAATDAFHAIMHPIRTIKGMYNSSAESWKKDHARFLGQFTAQALGIGIPIAQGISGAASAVARKLNFITPRAGAVPKALVEAAEKSVLADNAAHLAIKEFDQASKKLAVLKETPKKWQVWKNWFGGKERRAAAIKNAEEAIRKSKLEVDTKTSGASKAAEELEGLKKSYIQSDLESLKNWKPRGQQEGKAATVTSEPANVAEDGVAAASEKVATAAKIKNAAKSLKDLIFHPFRTISTFFKTRAIKRFYQRLAQAERDVEQARIRLNKQVGSTELTLADDMKANIKAISESSAPANLKLDLLRAMRGKVRIQQEVSAAKVAYLEKQNTRLAEFDSVASEASTNAGASAKAGTTAGAVNPPEVSPADVKSAKEIVSKQLTDHQELLTAATKEFNDLGDAVVKQSRFFPSYRRRLGDYFRAGALKQGQIAMKDQGMVGMPGQRWGRMNNFMRKYAGAYLATGGVMNGMDIGRKQDVHDPGYKKNKDGAASDSAPEADDDVVVQEAVLPAAKTE